MFLFIVFLTNAIKVKFPSVLFLTIYAAFAIAPILSILSLLPKVKIPDAATRPQKSSNYTKIKHIVRKDILIQAITFSYLRKLMENTGEEDAELVM